MSKSHDEYTKKREAIGERFRIFRRLLQKSEKDFADETLRQYSEIRKIEEGTFLPDIEFIGYFCNEYGLDIMWLVHGKGNVFFTETVKTPRYIYNYCQDNPTDIESLNAFLENFNLDQEPGTEESWD